MPAAEVPARVEVIGPEALAQTGAASVAGVLADRAGLFVKDYGSGGLATLSMRGATAAQTLVLLDGHRIADPQLGQLDLSLLPAALLRSVEVAHGGGSARYGTDAVGGVVNLRTLTPGGEPAVHLAGGAGAFGERVGSALLSGRQGAFSAVVAAEVRAADGDFPYVNEALFPPRTVRRANADRQQLSVFSKLRYDAGRHDVRLGGWLTEAERGLPGLATTPSTGERQWDTGLRLWADDDVHLGWGTLALGAFLQRSRLRYRNPALDLDDTGRTLISSASAEIRAPASERWLLSAGGTGGYGRARHPRLAEDAHQWKAGAFASGTGSYGRLTLYPSLRADAYVLPDLAAQQTTRVALSPELGLNAGPLAALPALRAKARAGRAFRMPTFNDRFWQPGGDPDLAPERSWSADAGLLWDGAGPRLEATGFAHFTRDQIVWAPTEAGYYAPENVQQVRALGLELSAEEQWQPARSLRLDAGLTYVFTDARDRSDPASKSYGEPLRYTPRQQLKSHLTAALGPAALDLSARYTSRRYVTSDGSQSLAPFVVADAQVRAGRTVAGVRAELAVQVENLFDADYAILQNRPLPGRHARLRLTLQTSAP